MAFWTATGDEGDLFMMISFYFIYLNIILLLNINQNYLPLSLLRVSEVCEWD